MGGVGMGVRFWSWWPASSILRATSQLGARTAPGLAWRAGPHGGPFRGGFHL